MSGATASGGPAVLPRSSLWDLVTRRAGETPGIVMAVDELGRSITFGAFRQRAEQAAAGLRELGVRAGTTVAWQLPTSIEATVLMAALARLGAVQAPVLPILRERELTFIARQLTAGLLIVPGLWRGFDHPAMARAISVATGCQVLVADPEHPDPAAPGGVALPWANPAGLPPASTLPAAGEDPVRWVFYTSGTTADPKGVKHSDVSAVATSIHLLSGLALGAGDITLLVSPITHVGGIMTLAAQLMTGFRTVLMRAFDPVRTPRLAAEHGITVLRAPVPVVRACLDAQRAHGPGRLYPDLRACQCGGAARPADLNEAVRGLWGLRGVLSSYGMTECPGVTAISPGDTEDRIKETSGRLTPGTELRVVDATGRLLDPGHEGELLVRGPQLFSGYIDPGLDNDAFDADRFFRSGDLGIVDADGYVRVTGRIKDIIIRNGENISALEIENVLSTHPAIADVAVIGLPDARTGERCCAVVDLAAGQTSLTLDEVADFCRAAGIARQKIPEQLELGPVPRNSMGKVEKQVLRARFAAA